MISHPRFLAVLLAWLSLLMTGISQAGTLLEGIVQTGERLDSSPLSSVPVTLYQAGPATPEPLQSTVTDASGHFLMDVASADSSGVFYIQANLGDGIELMALLGHHLPTASITVNELTSVGAAYALAQFLRTGAIIGHPSGLRIAAGMSDNLTDTESGQPATVLLTSPNADQTVSLRTIRSLADILAACVADHALAERLFHLTRSVAGDLPGTTTQALANLARNPAQNVSKLYKLSRQSTAYRPALKRIPDAWTVTVKINDSGSDSQLIGGPGNLVFDKQGYAWVTNNVVQGETFSSNTLMVFKPNGKPADGSSGTPKSPITGGGILGSGFGITRAPDGHIWTGNFGWGGYNPSEFPPGNGSVTEISGAGVPLSLPYGYFGGVYKAQGMATDPAGNIWIASYGNDKVCVFPKGNPQNSNCFQEPAGSHPFDMQIAPDGAIWVANTGDLPKVHSSVAKLSYQNDLIIRQFVAPVGKMIKGIDVDSRGNLWIGSGGDSKVYGMKPNGTLIGAFSGGGVKGPWSVTVDGDDNIWVANFGPLHGNFGLGRVSKLQGVAGIEPVGTPLSPARGFTVRSAGEPVRLHNGEPLYGPGARPSFSPLMRLTRVAIDQAGNLWALNNWKPKFSMDLTSNPGGDGIVIFVGLAKPLNR